MCGWWQGVRLVSGATENCGDSDLEDSCKVVCVEVRGR